MSLKMKTAFTVLLFSFFLSCSYNYESKNYSGYDSGCLVHTVVLDLNPELEKERISEIVDLLSSLGKIKQTKGLTVSKMANTDDPRAKKDYDLILQMAFKSEKDLANYSTNPSHLEIRSLIKDDLADVPIVYDYWVE